MSGKKDSISTYQRRTFVNSSISDFSILNSPRDVQNSVKIRNYIDI